MARTRLKERAGWRLRRLADRIDPANTPRHTGASFTFEHGRGVVLRWDGRGCPIWYLSEADHGRAYSEAESDWGRPGRPGDVYVKVTARKREED